VTTPIALPEVQFAGDQSVRLTPTAPMGLGSSISGEQIAEIGAMIGAMDGEKGATIGLLHLLQAITIKSHVEALPQILAKVQELVAAQVNRAMQEIQAMPGYEIPRNPPGALARLSNTTTGPTDTYISKDQVLRLLAVAMRRMPHTKS
jgi:hypothetical protein